MAAPLTYSQTGFCYSKPRACKNGICFKFGLEVTPFVLIVSARVAAWRPQEEINKTHSFFGVYLRAHSPLPTARVDGWTLLSGRVPRKHGLIAGSQYFVCAIMGL